MTSVHKKPPLAVVLSLFLTGIFLSVESVRLMLNCRWKSEETGFFIALCAIEITAGFIFVSANKRKMMDFLYLSYSRKQCGGEELEPSSFIAQISDAVGKLPVTSDIRIPEW